MWKIVGLVIVLCAVFAGAYFFGGQQLIDEVALNNEPNQTHESDAFSFGTPLKSPHYVSNTPEHGAIVPAVPSVVVIDFNFDLAGNSDITVKQNAKDYSVGAIEIDDNKLTMRKKIESNSPDGFYTVDYKACWPDGSCHNGSFQFAIDRTKKSDYTDLRNKKEVTVDMTDIKFAPEKIRISKGTKVKWVNNDEVTHYVNTDSHPSHTYFPKQNSKALKKGDTYSVTFSDLGIYPYHCSAHAQSMTGLILVEN